MTLKLRNEGGAKWEVMQSFKGVRWLWPQSVYTEHLLGNSKNTGEE